MNCVDKPSQNERERVAIPYCSAVVKTGISQRRSGRWNISGDEDSDNSLVPSSPGGCFPITANPEELGFIS